MKFRLGEKYFAFCGFAKILNIKPVKSDKKMIIEAHYFSMTV